MDGSEVNTYDFDLLTVLVFGYLGGTLSVEVSRLDLVLELTEFRALSADLLNLSGVLFLVHLHASHFTGEVLLEARHVNLAVGADGARTVSDTELLAIGGVERCLSECHFCKSNIMVS